MISRRLIIEQQEDLIESSCQSSKYSSAREMMTKQQQQYQQRADFSRQQQMLTKSSKFSASSSNKVSNARHQQQTATSNNGNKQQYGDYHLDHDGSEMSFYAHHQEMLHEPHHQDDYRHFDPYSVHGEDEDVWYSEDRLFEDHLEEIFNKWRLLDDDIWCKLIIMERNRRIGKAYARVPIVTIDGSHELSYDGYKLALNGFDNPDRDARTEECRKRIGKGIRIKMDNLGNILIKRLSKSGVYIKEWIQTNQQQLSSASNSSSKEGPTTTTTAAAATTTRLMPTRQQLIKNQMFLGKTSQSSNAKLISNNNSSSSSSSSSMGLLNSSNSLTTTTTTQSSSSAGSSMEPSNDSAICDEVISVGGRLDQDKIYIMFDMKKFQANITQELCRPYPDKRKLEQQCFSIVGLARDAEDILNLPCWVMVINIVAIEMLNERFPLSTRNNNNHHNNNLTTFPDTILYDCSPSQRHTRSSREPNFVNIFDRHHHHRNARNAPLDDDYANNDDDDDDVRLNNCNKEEDPYSLPANVSTSDVKSSINDYGTTSTRGNNINSNSNGLHLNSNSNQQQQQQRYACKTYEALPSKTSHLNQFSSRADMYAQKMIMRNASEQDLHYKNQSSKSRLSKSNANIYNPRPNNSNGRYNNASSSIYSPGHMLVPPSMLDSQKPPKLPPRDFVKKEQQKATKTEDDDNIYSVGMELKLEENVATKQQARTNKSKKNKFLESLKAPLELAKSGANRSASVMGVPIHHNNGSNDKMKNGSVTNTKSKSSSASTSGFGKSGAAKNLKSFLGVSSKSNKQAAKEQAAVSDDSNYVHVDDGMDEKSSGGKTNDDEKNNYNDLDIPTPDYETDENIYAIEEGFRGGGFVSKKKAGESKAKVKSRNNKDDLYYSGFRAHVPQNIGTNQSTPAGATSTRSGAVSRSQLLAAAATTATGNQMRTDKMPVREGSRFGMSKLHQGGANNGNKVSGRELIYGSTTGLLGSTATAQQAPVNARFRSASMQRNYPIRSQLGYRSQTEMYNLESENPYAMSNYGSALAPHRKRAGSKGVGAYGNAIASSIANNYDIGRSSSGIYGNNSSSSSSDYADWHPQMRKVNSSGYLNSIFKSHLQSSPLDAFNNNNSNNTNTNTLNGNNNNPVATIHGYNNNNSKQRSYTTSRAVKSLARQPSSSLSPKQRLQQQQNQQKQQVAPSAVNGPTYRSYDSSNDSEPSYTNSSDGLDIYDHIDAHSKLNHHHHHFLDLSANMAPEVHVGEWENMYER